MPLTIQYCSDLHLEFPLNEQYIKKYPLQVAGDILVLAGDIVPFAIMDKQRYFFDFVADNYVHTYWLPGNHEYYNADIKERSGVVQEEIRSNVTLVNNTTAEHDNIQLTFSTLWSHIDEAYSWQIERAMSDFHVISNNGRRFSIPAFNRLHADSVTFIQNTLAAETDKARVVVSHHIPTFLNYPAQYKGDILSQAFATELGALIDSSNIHSWIYGHHHTNTPDFTIGATHMLTNQLGYVKHGEHRTFNGSKALSI